MLLALSEKILEVKMNIQEIELYHDLGLMPDRVYYQVNGKSAEENYRDIVNKRNKAFRDAIIKSLSEPKTEPEDYNFHITSEVKFK